MRVSGSTLLLKQSLPLRRLRATAQKLTTLRATCIKTAPLTMKGVLANGTSKADYKSHSYNY